MGASKIGKERPLDGFGAHASLAGHFREDRAAVEPRDGILRRARRTGAEEDFTTGSFGVDVVSDVEFASIERQFHERTLDAMVTELDVERGENRDDLLARLAYLARD
jgi:hypothetical protein